MKKLALEKYRKEIQFSYATYENPAIEIFKDVLRLKKVELPIFLLTRSIDKESDDLDKYRGDKLPLTVESVEKFIDDFKNNITDKFLISEDIPLNKTTEDGVYKLVGKNFNDFLANYDKDILLVVCSRVSKTCTRFNKILKNIANIFRNNKDLLIGIIDLNFNELKIELFPNYPSLMFFSSGNTIISAEERFNDRILFEEKITTERIRDFVIRNSLSSLQVNTIDNQTEIFRNETLEINEIIPVKGNEYNEEDIEPVDITKEFAKENPNNELYEKMAGDNFDFKNILSGMGKDGANIEELSKLKELLAGFGGDFMSGGDEDDEQISGFGQGIF